MTCPLTNVALGNSFNCSTTSCSVLWTKGTRGELIRAERSWSAKPVLLTLEPKNEHHTMSVLLTYCYIIKRLQVWPWWNFPKATTLPLTKPTFITLYIIVLCKLWDQGHSSDAIVIWIAGKTVVQINYENYSLQYIMKKSFTGFPVTLKYNCPLIDVFNLPLGPYIWLEARLWIICDKDCSGHWPKEWYIDNQWEIEDMWRHVINPTINIEENRFFIQFNNYNSFELAPEFMFACHW